MGWPWMLAQTSYTIHASTCTCKLVHVWIHTGATYMYIHMHMYFTYMHGNYMLALVCKLLYNVHDIVHDIICKPYVHTWNG